METTSRLLIVAGKGGVGKTVATAVLARTAADDGANVAVVAIDGRRGIVDLLAGDAAPELGIDETELCPATASTGWIRGRVIESDHALVDYLDGRGFHRLTGRLARTGAVEVAAHAVPGMNDLLVLGKLKALVRDHPADLLILDAPASGHAISFLRAPRTVAETVSGGPVRAQADDVLAMLSDHARCEVVLVTVPEETPVNELISTAFAVEDELGVALGPVMVNGVLADVPGLDVDPSDAAARAGATVEPDLLAALGAAARFRLARGAAQRVQLERLDRELALPQIRLALHPRGLGPDQVAELAAATNEQMRTVGATPIVARR